MSLIAEIKEQLDDAMREKDTARRDTLRLILASLQGAEKELQRELHDDEELQVLQRERKNGSRRPRRSAPAGATSRPTARRPSSRCWRSSCRSRSRRTSSRRSSTT